MNKQEFINKALALFSLTEVDVDEVSNQLDIYKQFLQDQNKITNLTRLDSDADIWSKYFWQSILVYDKVDFSKINTLLDVGSGSGIPGLVLKIFLKNIHLTIVESNNKKCQFMSKLSEMLKLDNVEIISNRIEKLPTKNKYDMVTAKAVAPLEIILELLVPYCKVDGLIVVPKSKNYLSEIKDLNKELKQLSAKLINVEKIVDNGFEFNTIYALKIGETNNKYPREYAKIIKGFDYDKK